MFNLSLTACSFHFRKTNSKKNTQVYDLNAPLCIKNADDEESQFSDLLGLFCAFFEKYKTLVKDDNKQQSFRCEYSTENCIQTSDFKMLYVKIYSGIYGSSSDIIDGDTQKIKYQKTSSDIDTRPFYLMIVFPKDSSNVIVQKGMFIFQNVGQFGVKTITTSKMQEFFSSQFNITLKCNTIAPDLFIRKVIRKENIKKFVMIKNYKSSDIADNIDKGYGIEVREIGNLSFSESKWDSLMGAIRYVAGSKSNLFEFEQQTYENLKLSVDIGGRTRTINLHNLENLSIIEGIPDEIKMADGHPNLGLLIDHFKKVATEYLEEMVLRIS